MGPYGNTMFDCLCRSTTCLRDLSSRLLSIDFSDEKLILILFHERLYIDHWCSRWHCHWPLVISKWTSIRWLCSILFTPTNAVVKNMILFSEHCWVSTSVRHILSNLVSLFRNTNRQFNRSCRQFCCATCSPKRCKKLLLLEKSCASIFLNLFDPLRMGKESCSGFDWNPRLKREARLKISQILSISRHSTMLSTRQ